METRMATKEQKSVLKDILASITKMRDDLKTHIGITKAEIDSQISELETMKEEADDKYEEMSEKQQEGDKGQELQTLIDDIDTATDLCNSLVEKLEEDDPFEDLVTHLEGLIK
jgi:predicted  nucleic acid-binding Zn-ribbon protein